MAKFIIPYSYRMSGKFTVEANSLAEALDAVATETATYNIDPDGDDEYDEYSFEVNYKLACEMNGVTTEQANTEKPPVCGG